MLIPPRPVEIPQQLSPAAPILLQGITYGTEPVELLTASRNRVTIPNGVARMLSVRVTGRTETFATTYGASILVVAQRTGGTVTLSAQQTFGPVGSGGTIAIAPASGTPPAVSIVATGELSEPMLWVTEVEIVELRWPHFLDTFQGYSLTDSAALDAAWPAAQPSQPWHNPNPISILDRDPDAYIGSTVEVTGITLPTDANGSYAYDGLYNGHASFKLNGYYIWFSPSEFSYVISAAKGLAGGPGWALLPGNLPDGSYVTHGSAEGDPVATVNDLASGNQVLYSSGGLRGIQFDPIAATDAAPLKWSFRFFDPYNASDPKSGREYAELRRDDTFVIFAAGLHNSVNVGTYSLSKYQFRNVGGAGWIQLNAPRSRGWHFWEIVIRRESLDVYVDGVLDPNGTNLSYAPGSFDTIHLGSLIQTNTPLFYDNVTLGRA